MEHFKKGFTLIETLIACGIMVMAFAIIAIIFGRAYDISKTIKRGSKNEQWGAYLMNTILYGPGKTSAEGLIAAYRVYHPDSSDYPFTAPYTDNQSRSRFLCFSTSEKKPIIFELVNYELTQKIYSLYRNKSAGPDYNYSDKYFDLKPTYAKEGKLEIYSATPPSTDSNSSGFYFYDEHNNIVSDSDSIKRVGIKLVIKNAFQNLNQAIVLYQNLRIRNLYSLE